MKPELYNKLSEDSKERIKQIEARIRELHKHQEELDETIKYIEANRGTIW